MRNRWLIAALLGGLGLSPRAEAAVTIDGSATNGTACTLTTCAVTLTTSNSGDVIMVGVRVADGTVGQHPTIASVTAAGGIITFTKETAQTLQIGSNASGAEISLWTAVSSLPLSSLVLTANINNTSASAARITAWGLTGADTTTIFDNNASVPGKNSASGATSLANASPISTNCATELLVGFLGGDTGLTSPSRPSGFTQILATGTVNDFSTNAVVAQQSSQTYTWSWTGSQGAGLIVTAVRAATCASVAAPPATFLGTFPQ